MVPIKIIDEISGLNVLTDRVKKRREQYFASNQHLDAERTRLITESFKETEGQPLDIRRAKGFKKVMEELSVVIREGELIVGSQCKYIKGTSPAVDFNSLTFRSLLETKESFSLAGRGGGESAQLGEEERLSLIECVKYWLGKSPHELIDNASKEILGEQLMDMRKARLYTTPHGTGCVGRLPNYKKIFAKGIKGIIAEAREEIQKLKSLTEVDAIEKYYFLQAVIIGCEAVITFANRHAELAKQMAGKEGNPERKKELEKIADICRWVPANPPRSFQEAIQCHWFIHLAMNLEAAAAHEVPGRPDQYLYPYYKKDIEEGKITRQEVMEYFGCLWVKYAEMVEVKGQEVREIAETNQGQNMTLGGVDSDGKDGSNELTYMLLETAGKMKTTQPAVYLRVHRGTPNELLIKGLEINKERGDGVPAMLNDDAEIPYLLSRNVDIKDARDWAGTGCVYGLGTGFVPDRHVTVSHAKIFELTLNNGFDPKTGKQLGLKTGDPRDFSSFEELYEAFKKQDEYFISYLANYHRLFWQVRNTCYSLPFNSALLDDCIKNGKNFFAGGIRYPQLYWGLKDRGHQNVADALAAIKKLVFEEKKITMDRLLEALTANFEGDGNEEIRRMCLAAPKYGNDDDYVDDIFNDFSLWAQRRIVQEKHALGVPMRSGRGGATTHAFLGKTIGAFPDGRKAYEPLADGSLSPMRGVDMKGPTAVINSASKVNHTEKASYSLFNMKITPAVLKTKEGIGKVNALTRTYFDRGGYHIQYNLMGQKTLLEAKKHPEQHRELLVRVAGYSAYFVELSPEIQDDIIARTEHTI
jgi:pyruvate formate-lyase/glycerol dehydratase family glycyl radical enzyme